MDAALFGEAKMLHEMAAFGVGAADGQNDLVNAALIERIVEYRADKSARQAAGDRHMRHHGSPVPILVDHTSDYLTGVFL